MMSDAATTPAVEDNRLRGDFLRAVEAALEADDAARVRELATPLHPADLADLFEQLATDWREPLAAALGDMLDADTLSEMNEWVRDEVIATLEPAQVAEAVSEMDTDDAVALIEEMEPEDAQAVLDEMAPDDRVAIETALSYPEESAGRLMQRELIAVPEHLGIGQVIDWLRDHPETGMDFWEIFVVDPAHKPVGTMRLSWVLTTPRDIPVADVMQREQTLIPVTMDQEEVALRFQKYALISAAVVDEDGRLVGVITVDDIVHIISQEAGEDILKMTGAGDGDINEPVLDSYKARVKWLIANLGTALISSTVIAQFEGTIEKMVILAALTPIVASIGGNAGTQTMAVAVRALATDQLTEANTWRTIRREIRVALLNGLTIAALLGLGVAVLLGNMQLGAVIAAAALFNIMVAGLAGVLVPVTLNHFRADPAVASSVFVTMTTDTMGFLAFLTLASLAGLTG
ncbi:magnesium transporter [Sandaracinobacteroides saxicola]|uniref:Magnesium transporter MgtE n=1 Tax=Sandaracinobacteroides saxicola TaxID=2759707 RepID=A0A7G5IHN0_9SPHN|nr:magnesium transporter [Sandaracinobacteroides saxicola]QMW22872.1 magnesium transporter [Sandaracinobacteroides saxicola]